MIGTSGGGLIRRFARAESVSKPSAPAGAGAAAGRIRAQIEAATAIRNLRAIPATIHPRASEVYSPAQRRECVKLSVSVSEPVWLHTTYHLHSPVSGGTVRVIVNGLRPLNFDFGTLKLPFASLGLLETLHESVSREAILEARSFDNVRNPVCDPSPGITSCA